jgi:hypothetical protein
VLVVLVVLVVLALALVLVLVLVLRCCSQHPTQGKVLDQRGSILLL